MSVVISRKHPSGERGLSIASFSDTEKVVLGIGLLADMNFIELSTEEAMKVSDELDLAALESNPKEFALGMVRRMETTEEQ